MTPYGCCKKPYDLRLFYWQYSVNLQKRVSELGMGELALLEKCQNTKFFPVFSPSTGKYGPDETPYFDTFHAV